MLMARFQLFIINRASALNKWGIFICQFTNGADSKSNSKSSRVEWKDYRIPEDIFYG